MADSPVVETRAGRLRGRMRRGVAAFRGIPYARPPVGPDRFVPPRPAEPWTGVREARAFGRSPPQPGAGAGLLSVVSRLAAGRQSEDCLTLNVWAPAPLEAGAGRPVMVWLYGGAFVLGSASTFLYSGHRLAAAGDVVVVSFNYRLGALGWLDLGALGASCGIPPNLGLMDQIAALSWVQDNVEAFGGDPARVTVFGESAGAMSVGALLGCPRAAGLFQRAILQSGASHNVSSRERAAACADLLLRELGIPRPQAERLREVPAGVLASAQRAALPASKPGLGRLPWQPTVDGELLPRPAIDAVRAGAARNVDVLVGTNGEEWKLLAALDPRMRFMGERELAARTAAILGRYGLPGEDAEEALGVYRESPRGGRASAYDRWIAFRSDEVFHLPAVRLAAAQAASGGSAFLYRFEQRVPRLKRILGACHGAELPLVFGALGHPLVCGAYAGSRAAFRLSRNLVAAWTAFARTGRPRAGGLPAWPAFGGPGRPAMILDTVCRVGEDPGAETRAFWERRFPSRFPAGEVEGV